MKKFLAALLLASLVACGTTSGPATGTLKDKIALVVESATTARQSSTAAFRAGKISSAADLANQANIDKIVAAAKAATTIEQVNAQATALSAIPVNMTGASN